MVPFVEIGWAPSVKSNRYSKWEMIHTRYNTCKDHTDQIFYQNEDDNTFICLCSCWTDSIMDTDPRAVPQRRS